MTFKNSRSCGSDGISNLVLKSVASSVSKPLSHIINLSMKSGKFPSKLKTALIKPLYKKKEKTKPENYRPIALTSPFSKVHEKIYLNRIMPFLYNNNVMTKSQFGYKNGVSCTDATIALVDQIVSSKFKVG